MSQSGRVRLRDFRRACRLIHDCRDVGHDPAAWRAVLIEGVAGMVDASVVIASEFALAGECAGINLADRWPDSKLRERWMRDHVVTGDYRNTTSFRRYSALQGGLITRTREQLVEDGEWYISSEFNEAHRTFGVDDLMASNLRSGDPPMLYGFQALRALGTRRFLARERRLVRLFHRELAPHLGTTLAREPGGPLAGLTPRLRQTLECLLEGDGEKQVALKLGLSRHTVHEYVKALYRRFRVNSRGELLATCLRHRPDPRPGA